MATVILPGMAGYDDGLHKPASRRTMDLLISALRPSPTDGSQYDINIVARGGDVVQMAEDNSQFKVLWGELFKEKEREFLRKNITRAMLCMSIKETFRVYAQALWRKEVKLQARYYEGKLKPGRSVIFLHGFKWRLNQAWSWGKFLYPFTKEDMNVVALDLPGNGKGMVGHEYDVPFKRWMMQDWQVLVHCIEDLGVPKVNLVLAGESCGTFFRVMKNAKKCLAGSVVFIDPIYDIKEVFEPAPGEQRRDTIRFQGTRNQDAVRTLIVSRNVKIWVIFTKDHEADTECCIESINDMAKSEVTSMYVTVTHVGKSDLHHAQIGADVKERFWYPCRKLKQAICVFIRHDGIDLAKPNYRPASASVQGIDDSSSCVASSYGLTGYSSWASMTTGSVPPTVTNGSTTQTPRSHGAASKTTLGSVSQSASQRRAANGPRPPSSLTVANVTGRGRGNAAGSTFSGGFFGMGSSKSAFQLPLVDEDRPMSASNSAPDLRSLKSAACGSSTTASHRGQLLPHIRPNTAFGEEELYAGSTTEMSLHRSTTTINEDSPESRGVMAMTDATKRARKKLFMDPKKRKEELLGANQIKNEIAKEDHRNFKMTRNMQKSMSMITKEDVLRDEMGDMKEALENSILTNQKEFVVKQAEKKKHQVYKQMMEAKGSGGDGGALVAFKIEMQRAQRTERMKELRDG